MDVAAEYLSSLVHDTAGTVTARISTCPLCMHFFIQSLGTLTDAPVRDAEQRIDLGDRS